MIEMDSAIVEAAVDETIHYSKHRSLGRIKSTKCSINL
jgi:hypothetical protein